MRSLARSFMEAGAAGVMIAPVPSLRTDDQIVTYFRQAVEAQRKPGASLSSTAKTEVDYLLARLAKLDKRAELKPRLAQAS
jgi:hypothetical protein